MKIGWFRQIYQIVKKNTANIYRNPSDVILTSYITFRPPPFLLFEGKYE
jgi:hypothetical protein